MVYLNVTFGNKSINASIGGIATHAVPQGVGTATTARGNAAKIVTNSVDLGSNFSIECANEEVASQLRELIFEEEE